MTREQIIAAVVGAVVLAWPRLVSLAGKLKLPATSAGVGFEAAIHDLASVRSRLLATSLLDEPARKAIDTLTLQLVAGSEK